MEKQTFETNRNAMLNHVAENLCVQRFHEEDAAEVSALVAGTLREVNKGDYSEEEIEEIIRHMQPADIISRASGSHFYVLRLDEKIVGCGAIGYYWGRPDESILLTIFVHKDYQGLRIGRRIIETLEADELFRNTIRTEIPASITGVPFYLKFGYTYKNGITEPDDERLIRLEKYR